MCDFGGAGSAPYKVKFARLWSASDSGDIPIQGTWHSWIPKTVTNLIVAFDFGDKLIVQWATGKSRFDVHVKWPTEHNSSWVGSTKHGVRSSVVLITLKLPTVLVYFFSFFGAPKIGKPHSDFSSSCGSSFLRIPSDHFLSNSFLNSLCWCRGIW